MRPTYELSNETEPNLLYFYKGVAPIFMWGRETPTHAFVCIIFEFFMLYVFTFHAFYTCCSFLSLTHLMHRCVANGIILLKHFHLLMHCLCISRFHIPDVDVLVVKVFS